MSASDKASGKSQSITITSDRGRLDEKEIERMLKEAEEFAESDRIAREAVEARNQLEAYLYSVRTSVSDTLKDKISAEDKEKVLTKVTDTLSWMEANKNETKEVYDEQRKEVEAIATPVITKAYQASSGGPSSPSNDSSPDADGGDGSSGSGPKVEEVD